MKINVGKTPLLSFWPLTSPPEGFCIIKSFLFINRENHFSNISPEPCLHRDVLFLYNFPSLLVTQERIVCETFPYFSRGSDFPPRSFLASFLSLRGVPIYRDDAAISGIASPALRVRNDIGMGEMRKKQKATGRRQKEQLIFRMKREKKQLEMNDRFLEDLKNRTDIVELVRKYAELKKAGKNYMCRSPFRNERTPSFCVSADKQFWYDFGTSEGGDAISFLEKIENISFREAVEMLADIAGVEIPQTFGKGEVVSKEEKKDIFALHERANFYFARELQNTKKAAEYLASRGISEEVIKDWGLGYGGDTEDGLTKFLLSEGFSESKIAESGVAFEREFGDKKMRDRFFGRLMIPIRESREGKIIAFTGRDLSGKKDVAKYVNSPENPVYHKSATLFGLERARKVIREKDFAILVEGNFDVISAHSGGFCNTVATCGTSLTEDHLRLIKRLTKNVYLAFDNDIAGKKATLRAVEMTLKMELSPFVIEIPEGKDLDELVRKNASMLQKVVEGAQNALLFLCDKFAAKYLTGSIEGEKKFLDALFYFLRFVFRPVERDELLGRMAKKINRAKGIVEEEYRKYAASNRSVEKPETREEGKGQKLTREECFVGFLSAYWDFFADKISENVLDLFSGLPKELLEKKLIAEALTEEEQKILLSWELFEGNLYGEDISDDILERDMKSFIDNLKKGKEKGERQKFGQELGKKLRATEAQ